MRLLAVPIVRFQSSRRVVVWTAATLIAFTLAFFLRIVAIRHQDATGLQAIIARLDAAGPWQTIDLERRRTAIADDRNSAIVIAGLSTPFPLNTTSLPESDGVLPEHRWTPEQTAAVTTVLGNLPAEEPLWQKLRRRPTGRHPITFAPDGICTALPHVDRVDAALFRARWRVLNAAEENRADDALAELLAYSNIVRSLGDEPVSLTQHVRRARFAELAAILERVLAQTEPTVADLEKLLAMFDAELAEPTWRRYLESERAFVHDYYTALATGKLKFSVAQSMMPQRVAARPSAWDRALDEVRDRIGEDVRQPHATALELLTALLADADQPLWRQRLIDEIPPRPTDDDHSLVIHPTVVKTTLGYFQLYSARILCARISLKCELHRLCTGRYPDFLDDQTHERSPFNGSPLTLRPTTWGVEIICPGSPPTKPAQFRLFYPGRRRQPPIPPPPPAPPQHYRIEMVTP